jgi:hypothetical protein
VEKENRPMLNEGKYYYRFILTYTTGEVVSEVLRYSDPYHSNGRWFLKSELVQWSVQKLQKERDRRYHIGYEEEIFISSRRADPLSYHERLALDPEQVVEVE